jgi:hypothetical protein
MRRADSTSREYQLAWRGTHNIPGDGLYEYPDPKRATRKHGSRYLRCNCGWKLIEIARTRSEREKAGRLHAEHVADIQAARAEYRHYHGVEPRYERP